MENFNFVQRLNCCDKILNNHSGMFILQNICQPKTALIYTIFSLLRLVIHIDESRIDAVVPQYSRSLEPSYL